jgi:hypothetical protein
MSDYIERKKIWPALNAACVPYNRATAKAIDSIPAADVRPVVLCRDCYAYRRDNELAEAAYLDPKMYCGLLRCEMGEDSFCSYGKRKEET